MGWDTRQHVIVENKTIQGSSSGGIQDYYTGHSAWEDLESAIKKALAAPVETPFEISVRIAGTGATRIGDPTRYSRRRKSRTGHCSCGTMPKRRGARL